MEEDQTHGPGRDEGRRDGKAMSRKASWRRGREAQRQASPGALVGLLHQVKAAGLGGPQT